MHNSLGIRENIVPQSSRIIIIFRIEATLSIVLAQLTILLMMSVAEHCNVGNLEWQKLDIACPIEEDKPKTIFTKELVTLKFKARRSAFFNTRLLEAPSQWHTNGHKTLEFQAVRVEKLGRWLGCQRGEQSFNPFELPSCMLNMCQSLSTCQCAVV